MPKSRHHECHPSRVLKLYFYMSPRHRCLGPCHHTAREPSSRFSFPHPSLHSPKMQNPQRAVSAPPLSACGSRSSQQEEAQPASPMGTTCVRGFQQERDSPPRFLRTLLSPATSMAKTALLSGLRDLVYEPYSTETVAPTPRLSQLSPFHLPAVKTQTAPHPTSFLSTHSHLAHSRFLH